MTGLRGLDLNLLVVFEAVYSSRNITHAARSLGLTQPTISNALSRLRGAMDDPLFVRKGNGVEPTPRAQAMIGPVRDALGLLESGLLREDKFDPASHRRHFRLLLIDQLEPVLIPPLIRAIQDHRAVTVEALPIASTLVLEGLNDASIDIALAPHIAEAADCRQQVIGRADTVIAARRNHPAIRGEFTLDHYKSLGHIALVPKLRAMTRVDEYLRQYQITRHIVYTVSKFWSFPHLIATTDLIAQLPGDFAREAAKRYPIEIFPTPFEFPEQELYLIWKENRTSDPAHRWLREVLIAAHEKRFDYGDADDPGQGSTT